MLSIAGSYRGTVDDGCGMCDTAVRVSYRLYIVRHEPPADLGARDQFNQAIINVNRSTRRHLIAINIDCQ